jgi:hypothetical protein
MRPRSAFLVGAGAAYFFDPTTGKRRRHMARDRLLKAFRGTRRLTLRRLGFLGGHVRGAVAVAAHAVRRPEVATDDATVVQRIRSDALRDLGLRTKDVDVRVEHGVATLRGVVASVHEGGRLVSRVREVPGVRDVSAELRVAGE